MHTNQHEWINRLLYLCADDKWNEVKAFLASADSDGNGVLSKEEFKTGIAKLGISDADATAVANEVFILIGIYLPIYATDDSNRPVFR